MQQSQHGQNTLPAAVQSADKNTVEAHKAWLTSPSILLLTSLTTSKAGAEAKFDGTWPEKLLLSKLSVTRLPILPRNIGSGPDRLFRLRVKVAVIAQKELLSLVMGSLQGIVHSL